MDRGEKGGRSLCRCCPNDASHSFKFLRPRLCDGFCGVLLLILPLRRGMIERVTTFKSPCCCYLASTACTGELAEELRGA